MYLSWLSIIARFVTTSKSSISIDFLGFHGYSVPQLLLRNTRSSLVTRHGRRIIPSRNVYCVYQRELPAPTVHAAWHSSTLIAVNATWLHFRSLCSRCSPARDVEYRRSIRRREREIARTKVKQIRSALKTSLEGFLSISCFVRDLYRDRG